MIRVVKDKDWTKVKYNDLQAIHEYTDANGEEHRVPYNVFSMAKSAVQDMTEDLQNQKEAYRVAKQGDERKPVETQTARDNEKEALAAQRKRQQERNPEGILEEPAPGG